MHAFVYSKIYAVESKPFTRAMGNPQKKIPQNGVPLMHSHIDIKDKLSCLIERLPVKRYSIIHNIKRKLTR